MLISTLKKANLGGRRTLPWLSVLLGWGGEGCLGCAGHDFATQPCSPSISKGSWGIPSWMSWWRTLDRRSHSVLDWGCPLPRSPHDFLQPLCLSAATNTLLLTSFHPSLFWWVPLCRSAGNTLADNHQFRNKGSLPPKNPRSSIL